MAAAVGVLLISVVGRVGNSTARRGTVGARECAREAGAGAHRDDDLLLDGGGGGGREGALARDDEAEGVLRSVCGGGLVERGGGRRELLGAEGGRTFWKWRCSSESDVEIGIWRHCLKTSLRPRTARLISSAQVGTGCRRR